MLDIVTAAAVATTSEARTETPVRHAVAIARGDGIGPEITEAVLGVLEAAGAPIDWHEVQMGEKLYLAGHSSGIDEAAWATLRKTRTLLKAPLTTPQGGGYKSINVTLRKALGLYANVRPCMSYAPYVRGPAGMDLIVVRENEEDTYAGIEHRQTDEVMQCLKLITRPGCERIARYAFELARAQGRRKVTCMTKDNIMKLTDGLFRKVFEEIGREYPEIEQEHQIIDIGTARVATRPERYDVILTPNLYGDVLSDVAAEVAGSVGLAPSANIGRGFAMFEAIHGSAPDIAGKDLANPSGLLLSAVQMLAHLGLGDVASRVHNAWLKTIEDGVHTADLQGERTTKVVGCQAFGREVAARLGQQPTSLAPRQYANTPAALTLAAEEAPKPAAKKVLHGVDVFLHWSPAKGRNPEALASLLSSLPAEGLKLTMVTNRGVKVWPNGLPETWCSDHWRCRFEADGGTPSLPQVLWLLSAAVTHGLDVIKIENLYTYDGVPGYAAGQGQ